MSYQEKRTITSIITGLIVLFAYCFYAYAKYQSGAIATDNIKFWAVTILVFIGIGVVTAIVIQIVFHIVLAITMTVQEQIKSGKCDDKEIEKNINLEMVSDEMDKLIELKSMRIGFCVAGIGFVSGTLALVLNYSPIIMLNIMFISFCVGSLLEGFTQLYYYKKGV